MSQPGYSIINNTSSDSTVKYLFVSEGKHDIVKAIEYSYVQDFSGRKVYNLGFGDYDLEKDSIDDSSHSDNGDVYKVFNTVLTSIPEFFKIHDKGIMMVEGSDSKPAFTENCKLTCKKKCISADNCRNKNRRINVYRKYVNKNYEALIEEYSFFGGLTTDGIRQIEPYVIDKEYDSVLVIKK